MNVGALVTAILLLAANGFFVAAEFALLAARRSRMEQLAEEGDRRAAHALAGLRELSLMLAGAQLGITMASLGLGAVAEPALEAGVAQLLHLAPLSEPVQHALSLAIALSVVIFLHMVVGEMAPKSWAISDPERSVLLLARPFRWFCVALRPFIRLLNAMANAVVRALGVEPQQELAVAHTAADLLLLVEESAREGTLAEDQREMLSRALELSGLDAQSVMVPRGDVVAVPAAARVEEVERVAAATGRSRLPVYDHDLDTVRGVLHVKDLLQLDEVQRGTSTAASLARPALITPESRPVEDLMLDMRQQRQHVAMVVDEYGTVTGLVALEDLLEELIGEFEDESDRRQRAGRRRPFDGAVLLPGSLRPDEVADRLGLELPEGDYETVAGWIISELGRLPVVGDAVAIDGRRVEVVRMEGHRVVELAVSPPGLPPA